LLRPEVIFSMMSFESDAPKMTLPPVPEACNIRVAYRRQRQQQRP
jgi:hypothetical protein